MKHSELINLVEAGMERVGLGACDYNVAITNLCACGCEQRHLWIATWRGKPHVVYFDAGTSADELVREIERIAKLVKPGVGGPQIPATAMVGSVH